MPVRSILVCLLAIGLVVRLGLLAGVRDVGIHTDDERDYVTLAASMLDGHGFAFDGRPTSIRPPLYPAFVSAVWTVAPARSFQSVRAAQIGLSLLTVCLLFWTASRVFDPRVGLTAAAIWCFYPSFLYAGVLILTEVLFTTFVVGAWACSVGAIRGRRPIAWALGAGLCIGLGALTRSVLYPLPLFLAPVLAFLVSPRWATRAGVATAVLAGYVVVVTPWAVRNTRLQHTFIVVDTMGGMNLRMGNFEYTIEDRMWDGVSRKGDQAWSHQMIVEHPDASHWSEGQRDKWAREAAAAYIKAHPLTTMRRAVLKFADFWGLEREYIAALSAGKYNPPRWFKALSSVAVLGVYAAVACLCCVGLFGMSWTDWRVHVPGLLLVLWVCAIHSLVFGHSRYHLPLMPVIATYAAAAVVYRPWRRWAERPYARLATAGAVAVLALIWGHEVLIRDADRLKQFLG
jgi:4-amino-4-deoxy-L-arabinose transferase-like glycosyltransferase